MNIEIANRLVDLRKKSGLSQEELASRLGLSRQAVSKWERAEASPDTDNLICLAKLYGVSLDTLLNTDESIDDIVKEQIKPDENGGATHEEDAATKEEKESEAGQTKADSKADEKASSNKYNGFHMDDSGIHFGSGKDYGSIDNDGVHVVDEDGSSVHIAKNGIHISGANGSSKTTGTCHMSASMNRYGKRRHAYNVAQSIASSVTSILAVTAYILLGCLYPDPYIGWGTCWLVFLLIPLVSSFIEALKKRKFTAFAFPVLAAGLYVMVGMVFGIWHPTWLIFLSIPIYYCIFDPIDKLIKHRHSVKVDGVNIDFDDDDVIDEDKDEDDD